MTTFERPPPASAKATGRADDDDLAAAELRARLRRKMFGVRSAGATVGRYTIVERIGGGTMGDVYAATDATLGRTVALKVLQPAADDDPARRRLLREAQTIARLNHPNVVQIFEVGEQDGRVYFAMERIDGPTLEGWLRAKPRAWTEVVDAVRQAARGLAAAHAVGVVHRDVKPANLVIGSEGRVRVVDFGLAHAARSSSLSGSWSASTTGGNIVGTPGYMSPEHVGSGSIDARSDQFSLAVCLYEGLYGARPHRASDLQSLLRAIAAGRRDPVPRRRGVPRWVGRVVDRALQRDPEARFESLDAFGQALRVAPRSLWPRIAFATGVFAVGGGVLGMSSMHTPEVARSVVSGLAVEAPPRDDGAITRARSMLAEGEHDAALQLATRLLREAEARRDEREAAAAAVVIAGAQARRAHGDAIEAAFRAAEVAVTRAGTPAELRARLQEHRGAFAWERGQFTEARERFAQACAVDTSRCAWAHASRGESLDEQAPLGAHVVQAEARWLQGSILGIGTQSEGAADLRFRLSIARGAEALERGDVDAAEQARVTAERIAAVPVTRDRTPWRLHMLSARIALAKDAPETASEELEAAARGVVGPANAVAIEALQLRAALRLDPSAETVEALGSVVRAQWDPAGHPDRLAAVEAGARRFSSDPPRAIALVRTVLDELELSPGVEPARARLLGVLAEIYARDGRTAAAASTRAEATQLQARAAATPEPVGR
ncbi:MAG: serine/threonine-protein kinase [Myxococcota bacterium]